MANPVCLSPLKFYDSISKQCCHKAYAFNHISPLITPLHFIPSFQFVLQENTSLQSAYLRNTKDERVVSQNIAGNLVETGFSIVQVRTYYIAVYTGILPVNFITYEGQYYLELIFSNGATYYSEIFCSVSNTDDCLIIQYWNKGNNNFYLKNGAITFPNDFKFKLYLRTEIGKPEYSFEEEGTKRMGYIFIESQISKKVYKFNAVVPEFICDAMRIIRLCSDKIITSHGESYEAITFETEVDWQTQGDLASVTCEFETDNVIANLGGFVSPPIGGDYNNDYNVDFDKS